MGEYDSTRAEESEQRRRQELIDRYYFTQELADYIFDSWVWSVDELLYQVWRMESEIMDILQKTCYKPLVQAMKNQYYHFDEPKIKRELERSLYLFTGNLAYLNDQQRNRVQVLAKKIENETKRLDVIACLKWENVYIGEPCVSTEDFRSTIASFGYIKYSHICSGSVQWKSFQPKTPSIGYQFIYAMDDYASQVGANIGYFVHEWELEVTNVWRNFETAVDGVVSSAQNTRSDISCPHVPEWNFSEKGEERK